MRPTAALLALIPLLATACTSPQPAKAPPRPATRGVLLPLTKPTVAPVTQPAYSLSNFADQTLPATPAFASVSRQTTLRDIQSAIDGAMKDLFKDPNLGRNIVGPTTFVYAGMTGSLDEVFTLEIGFPVQPAYRPADGITVRALPAIRCLSVDFEGSLKAIDKAYDKLMPAIESRKLKRTGEIREVYFKWEGAASDGNQILIAVGVK